MCNNAKKLLCSPEDAESRFPKSIFNILLDCRTVFLFTLFHPKFLYVVQLFFLIWLWENPKTAGIQYEVLASAYFTRFFESFSHTYYAPQMIKSLNY